MQDDTRRLDLDWIRIAAFGLLIAYHVGMYYVTWDWHIKSPFASPAAEPWMLAVNPWRLSLLFLVSGCATAFLLRSVAPAPGRALLKRSRFLLLPLVFGMAVIVPPQSYYEVVDKLNYGDGYLAFWARYLHADHSFCKGTECLILPTWNHLWFVAYLWVYTALAFAVHAWVPARYADAARRALRGWRLWVLPWLVLAAARIWLLPVFGVTHALVDDVYNHAQYLSVYAIGGLIARDATAWDWIERRRWATLAVALPAYVAIAVYFTTYRDATPPEALRLAMRIVFTLFQWTAILAILGWARRHLAGLRDTRARRYLTDAVFCFYIVHQTSIIVAAHALRPFALAPSAEAPLLALITVATCVAAYEIARRAAVLRALFGIRGNAATASAWPAPATSPSPARTSP